MRRYLTWIIAGWLSCQVGAVVAAPFVLTATTATSSGAPVVCTCPGALPGQACPMHHPEHAPPPSGGFLLQNPCAPSPAAMLFLAGGLGLPIAPPVIGALAPSIEQPSSSPTAFVTRPSTPDSPPPRA
jgi:hypothetical protein